MEISPSDLAGHIRNLREHGDTPGALKLAKEGLANYPDAEPLLCQQGWNLLSCGMTREAENYFQKALAAAVPSAAAYQGYALNAATEKRYQEAAERYEAGLALFPEDETLLRGLQRLLPHVQGTSSPTLTSERIRHIVNDHLKSKQYDKALYFASKALKKGDDHWLYCRMATCNLMLKNYPAAEYCAEQAITLQPDNPIPNNMRADIALKQRKFDLAEGYYQRSIDKGIADSASYSGYAFAALEAGKLTQAEARYRDAMERFPEAPHILHGLAQTLIRRKNPAQAASLLVKQNERAPGNRTTLMLLAAASIRMQDTNLMEQAFDGLAALPFDMIHIEMLHFLAQDYGIRRARYTELLNTAATGQALQPARVRMLALEEEASPVLERKTADVPPEEERFINRMLGFARSSIYENTLSVNVPTDRIAYQVVHNREAQVSRHERETRKLRRPGNESRER